MMNSLPRVRAGLLRHELDGQVLIYDARDDRVHLLDTTTGHVFELLEQGEKSREGIVSALATRMNTLESESLLQLSIEELRKANLLETGPALPALSDISRRDLLRKVGLVGAAALAIPAIATLTATSAYAQASCIANGQLCLRSGAIGCCHPNTCNNINSITGIGTCGPPP